MVSRLFCTVFQCVGCIQGVESPRRIARRERMCAFVVLTSVARSLCRVTPVPAALCGSPTGYQKYCLEVAPEVTWGCGRLPLRQSWRRLTGVGAGARCPRRGLDRGVLSHRTCRAWPASLLSCSYLPSAPAGWPPAWASGRAGPGHVRSHGGRCGKPLLISSGRGSRRL